MSADGWERHFYNEAVYDLPEEDMKEAFTNPFGLDLETEAGRRELESKVNKIVADYPGCLVPEGDSFNFTAYYAKRAIKYGGDVSEFSTEVLESARAELEQQSQNEQSFRVTAGDGEGYVGTPTLGTEVSSKIEPEQRRAFMN